MTDRDFSALAQLIAKQISTFPEWVNSPDLTDLEVVVFLNQQLGLSWATAQIVLPLANKVPFAETAQRRADLGIAYLDFE